LSFSRTVVHDEAQERERFYMQTIDLTTLTPCVQDCIFEILGKSLEVSLALVLKTTDFRSRANALRISQSSFNHFDISFPSTDLPLFSSHVELNLRFLFCFVQKPSLKRSSNRVREGEWIYSISMSQVRLHETQGPHLKNRWRRDGKGEC
jgi:hypothetical protein